MQIIHPVQKSQGNDNSECMQAGKQKFFYLAQMIPQRKQWPVQKEETGWCFCCLNQQYATFIFIGDSPEFMTPEQIEEAGGSWDKIKQKVYRSENI